MAQQKTLFEIVRNQIGNEGPQLPDGEYVTRIEDELACMGNSEFLERISYALDEITSALTDRITRERNDGRLC